MRLLPDFGFTDRVSVEAKASNLAKVANLGLLLGLATSYCGLSQSEAFASTNSTWSSQPSWAAPERERTSPPAKTYTSKEKYSAPSSTSPFAPGSSNVALEMGQVFLMGNLGDQYSDSIGTGLRYTYGVSDLFAFESGMGYSNHTDGKFSMFSMQAGLRTNLAWYDRVIPYLSFGLGFYRPSYDVGSMGLTSNPNESISPLLFGVHLGPGVDLEITKQFFFGAALTFNEAFGNTQTLSNGKTFDVGGTYTSFFLHAGVTF
jgi:hypothetical protein